jgi:hypothetical protein
MNMLRTTLLALLLALSLSAGTITSDSLSLTWYTTNYSSSVASPGTIGTSVTTGQISVDGWSGSAELTTNVAGDGSFGSPSTVSLTNVSLTCESATGCGNIMLSFDATFNFASLPPEIAGAAPFGVSVTGSGPDAFFDYFIQTGDSYAVGNVQFLSGGGYNFSVSDFMGPGNGSAPNTVEIEGSFSVPSANYGDQISLPGSFDMQVGTDDNPAPEPGTWLLGSGGFAIAFAARAWRRRRQVASVR